MRADYNRYEIFRNEDGTTDQIPFVKLPENPTDKYEKFRLGFTRFDKLAAKYYGNEFFDFLITFANPQYISQFDIEDGELIRIPFPLEKARTDWEGILKAIRTR